MKKQYTVVTKKCLILLLFTVSFLATSSAQIYDAVKLSPRLENQLFQRNQSFYSISIQLADKADVLTLLYEFEKSDLTLNERTSQVIQLLQSHARNTQTGLLDYLKSKPSSEVAFYRGFG